MEANGGTLWRLTQAERRIERLDQEARGIPVLEREVKGLREDFGEIKRWVHEEVDELKNELRATRLALWSLTGTLVAASLGFALAALGGVFG